MNRAFTGDLPGDRLTISGGARSRSALRRRGRSRWVVPTLFFRPLIHLAGLPQQALDSAFDVLLGRRARLIDARAALGATDFRFGRLVVSMIKDVAFLRRRGVLNVDGRGLSRSGRDHGENQPCRHDYASPPRNGCALPARATRGEDDIELSTVVQDEQLALPKARAQQHVAIAAIRENPRWRLSRWQRARRGWRARWHPRQFSPSATASPRYATASAP
jgi:hypothetical protein